jgi:hypothetical protein
MGKRGSLSGGGIESRQTVQTKNPKREPINHPVSMNRASMIGLQHYINQDKGPLYQRGGVDSTPRGPSNQFVAGPGAGRQILPAGSQSRTPAPHSMGTSRKF